MIWSPSDTTTGVGSVPSSGLMRSSNSSGSVAAVVSLGLMSCSSAFEFERRLRAGVGGDGFVGGEVIRCFAAVDRWNRVDVDRDRRGATSAASSWCAARSSSSRATRSDCSAWRVCAAAEARTAPASSRNCSADMASSGEPVAASRAASSSIDVAIASSSLACSYASAARAAAAAAARGRFGRSGRGHRAPPSGLEFHRHVVGAGVVGEVVRRREVLEAIARRVRLLEREGG